MPIVKFVKNSHQSKTALSKTIDYVTQEKKTLAENGMRYVSGINCNGLNAYNEMMLTRSAYPFQGTNGKERFFYQYIQSFDSKDDITADEVHAIALEFAEQAWKGHEVVVATHIDRDHLHSHFIISPINTETGKRLRQSPQTLKHLRKLSDDICMKHGVKVLEPYDYKKPAGLTQGELRAAEKGESWKFELMFAVDTAMKKCKNKNEFFEFMKKHGYQVRWTKDRKNITYTCPNGMKCRDSKLHEEKYRKEEMEYEFQIRKLEEAERQAAKRAGIGGQNDGRIYGQMGSASQTAGYAVGTAGRDIQVRQVKRGANYALNAKRKGRPATGRPEDGSEGRVYRCDGGYQDGNGRLLHTGWEEDRRICFEDYGTGEYNAGYKEEVNTASDWNTYRSSGALSDSLYFVGNLFEMIDNQAKMPRRKHARLSQKEKEKRLAHGQKIEDEDNGFEQSM